MIKLTKFNSEVNKKGVFILNAEVIETIEETPDTVVTLINGKKLIVDEPMDEVVRRVMAYRRALHKRRPIAGFLPDRKGIITIRAKQLAKE